MEHSSVISTPLEMGEETGEEGGDRTPPGMRELVNLSQYGLWPTRVIMPPKEFYSQIKVSMLFKRNIKPEKATNLLFFSPLLLLKK